MASKKKRFSTVVSLLMSVVLAAGLCPAFAVAAPGSQDLTAAGWVDVQESGTWGNCPWTLEGGTLTIGPGTGRVQGSEDPSPWIAYKDSITSVIFQAQGESKVVAPASIRSLLAGLTNMASVDLSGLDTSAVTGNGFIGLFKDCSALTTLDARPLNTANATMLTNVFYGCSSLTSVDLTGLNTSKVTNIVNLFRGCANLGETKGFSTLNLSQVDNIDSAFRDCANVEVIALPGMTAVQEAPSFNNVFNGCTSLVYVDLSDANTSYVASTEGMFQGCSALMYVYVGPNWDLSSVGAGSSDNMFTGCTSITGQNGTTYNSAKVDKEYARVDGGPTSATPGYLWYKAASAYRVTFNSNGGTAVAARDVTAGQAIGALPTSTKVGYTLDGWYNGNTKVSASFVPTGDVMLTARWTANVTPSNKMHRLYNPYSGEHFYTASDKEKNGLVSLGWRYEGVGWNAPTTGKDVYRLYNKWTGDHHFTTSAQEKNTCVAAGWTYEGVGWKSGGTKPVYREYNPYADSFYHNYTASASEHKGLIAVGWKDEGVGWYGV